MRSYIFGLIVSLILIGCGSGVRSDSKGVVSSTGKAGSMARFALSGDYLYTINNREMNIFDVSTASNPTKVSKVHIPFDVETIFAYKQNLYIGANSGVYIYDNSMPTQPTRISEFIHAQSCDPVVMWEDIAFVTLNTGRDCRNKLSDVNSLEIIDMKDVENPRLIKAIDMWEPTGLGVDGSNLFVCDGDSGLKIFDINKSENNGTVDVSIVLKEKDESIDCYDVIAYQNTLIISNRENIRQFNYSSFPMEELGEIK